MTASGYVYDITGNANTTWYWARMQLWFCSPALRCPSLCARSCWLMEELSTLCFSSMANIWNPFVYVHLHYFSTGSIHTEEGLWCWQYTVKICDECWHTCTRLTLCTLLLISEPRSAQSYWPSCNVQLLCPFELMANFAMLSQGPIDVIRSCRFIPWGRI